MSFSFWVSNFWTRDHFFWNLEKLNLSFEVHLKFFVIKKLQCFETFQLGSIEKSKIPFFHLPKNFKFSQKLSIKIFDFTLLKIHPSSKKNRWKKNKINELFFISKEVEVGDRGGRKEEWGIFNFQYFVISVSICLCVRECVQR